MSDLENPKTDAQRNAAHLWMRQVVKVLNDNGVDRKVLLDKLEKRGMDSQWTFEAFKYLVYKPVFQKVTAVKDSTEEASTTDHNIVINGLSKWLAQEFHVVTPPFPDRYSQSEGL